MPKPPQRWLDYSEMQDVVEGTRFVPFKTPYKEKVNGKSFSADDLMRKIGNLGFVLNLVKTDRYYNPAAYRRREIQTFHKKLEGHGLIPTDSEINEIYQVVTTYMRNTSDSSKLIGVHCTHGVNRTGYIICRYMIEKLGIEPKDAIERFEKARGHDFDHEEYKEALLQLEPAIDEDAVEWHKIGGRIISWEPIADEADFDVAEILQSQRDRQLRGMGSHDEDSDRGGDRLSGDGRVGLDWRRSHWNRDSYYRPYEQRRYDSYYSRDYYHKDRRSRYDRGDGYRHRSPRRRDRSRDNSYERRPRPEWLDRYVGPRRERRSPSPRSYGRHRNEFEYSRYVGPRRRDHD